MSSGAHGRRQICLISAATANDACDAGPLFVSSGDLIADRRYRWALDLAARGDLAGAADVLAQAVELAPAFAAAWFALGRASRPARRPERRDCGLRTARNADPEDLHGARLQLARLGAGDAAPRMTDALCAHACSISMPGHFDLSLSQRLDYRGHRRYRLQQHRGTTIVEPLQQRRIEGLGMLIEQRRT